LNGSTDLDSNSVVDIHRSIAADEQTVLVVEDEPSVQTFIELLLVSSGYRVICASDGIEGLAAFMEHRHALSVVITDLKMPRLDGVGMVGAIRKEDRNVPIVVVSGNLDLRSVTELGHLNVNALLNKPFSMAALLKTITEASGRDRIPVPGQ